MLMNLVRMSSQFPRRMLLPGMSSQVLGSYLKQKYNDVSDDADSMLIKASGNEKPTIGINCRIETVGLVNLCRVRATSFSFFNTFAVEQNVMNRHG